MTVEPIPGEPARWFVTSDSRPEMIHIVDMDYHGAPACGCEQYMVRGQPCKHIAAVKQEQVKRWEQKKQTGAV